MTTEEGNDAIRTGTAQETRVRVVRVNANGREYTFAFTETASIGSPPKPITTEHLLQAVGGRFRGKPVFSSYAEDPDLSAFATSFYRMLLASTDPQRAIGILERFVSRTEVFAAMGAIRL